MKLRKEIWETVDFGKVVKHVEVNERDPIKRANAKYVSVEHLETLNLKIQGIAKEEQPTFSRTFKKGQILFAKRRAYQKKVAIADFDGICSPHIWALETNGKLIQELLPFIMQRDVFYEYVNANSAGTMSTYLKWPALSKYQFKLPPKDEQEKILSLFLTLEKQIEQTEAQEGNLRKLRTKLATELVSNTPKFGSLLNGNCKKVTLSDLAKESRATARNPLDEGIERFVGLEHIEPGNLKIQGWGNVADGTTFTKVFEEGDVLFGRRRAYLKKAAKADFKGLCSGDITVLKANPKNIKPELLPYYMSADPVFEFAVSNSAGSLSPRAKWRDLSKMELAIPDLKTQEEILKVFELLDKNIEGLANQKETLKKLKHKLLDEILG
ncbi:MAG: restriction endonuclease subunit S [Sphaerochaetaceae bacterium]|jgi:type I restriction enzyme S subunit|nr:restriction endonuclease subunit S [Sphaerochaetaceae bacterium]